MATLNQNQKAGEKIAQEDGELGVLSLIVGAFTGLEAEEKSRVLAYMRDRYTPPQPVKPTTMIYNTGGSGQPLPPQPQNLC